MSFFVVAKLGQGMKGVNEIGVDGQQKFSHAISSRLFSFILFL